MSFAYVGSSNAVVSGATEIDGGRPSGISSGNVVIAVFAFEGVAAGSGPWIVPNIGQLSNNYIGPPQGWEQVCWRSPSATGVGIEVWSAIHFSGTNQYALFAASYNCTMVSTAYSGEFNNGNPVSNGTVRLATTAQVLGHQPAAPNVTGNGGELIVACGGDLMTSSKFGSPSGFTNRVDVQRSGAGTVEATIADAVLSISGNTGPITFPNNASSGTTAGTTATLAIVPAPSAAGVGATLEASLPPDLDLPDGYVLTWAAIDPTTGADVAGVKVTDVSIFGTALGEGTGGGGGAVVGPFLEVPGPGA